jgi:hypothetical protein
MPTLTYLWVPPDSLVDLGNNANIAFIETVDPQPIDVWEFSSTSVVNSNESARKTATGFTWESLGIPPGSTVNSIDITVVKYLVNNTNLNTHRLRVRLVDSSGNNITTPSSPFDATLGNTLDSGYVSVGDVNGALSIGPSYQASNTDIRLELQLNLRTDAGSPNYLMWISGCELTIVYTDPVIQAYAYNMITTPFF